MIEGTVKLKKVTIGGAVYALSLPGFQTANLTVPVVLGAEVPIDGTVTVKFIPNPPPPKPVEDEPPKAKAKRKAKK